MWSFDADVLCRELIRTLRGKRSQPALSRHLGYRSNVVYTWESGRRAPAASELFRIVERMGGDPRSAFTRFAVDVSDLELVRPDGVAEVLARLRGTRRVAEVATRSGLSRFRTSRWLHGRSEPRVPDLLILIEALTLRVVDFVASLASPDEVPSIRERWHELQARRRVAFSHPWSQALLRIFETQAYRRRGPHSPRWIADRLGLEVAEVEGATTALIQAGFIRKERGRWVAEPVHIDTSLATDEERRALKVHWAEVSRRHLEAGEEGLFSWAMVALSRDDYRRMQELHVQYMQSVFRLAAGSEPSEVVALANVQLLPLGGVPEK